MAKQGQGFKILIADDEPEVVDLVRMILEWEGYTVVAAVDGLQTIARVREPEPPHLILLDVRMPKLSGLAVLEQLPEVGGGDIPVIMLSVVTTDPEVRTALQRGAIALVKSPVPQAHSKTVSSGRISCAASAHSARLVLLFSPSAKMS